MDFEQHIHISTVEHNRDSRPRTHQLSTASFEALLREHASTMGAKNGPAIIGALFDGQGKDNEHATTLTALCLDLDDLPDQDVEDTLRAVGFFGWMYSTWTHNNPHAPKYREGFSRLRIILPLLHTIEGTPQQLAHIWQHTINRIKAKLPKSAQDALDAGSFTRLAYLPRQGEGAGAPVVQQLDGPWLNIDPEHIPQPTTQLAPAPQRPLVEVSQLVEALAYFDPSNREDWINCGHAIKHTHGDDGYHVWEQWSLTANNADTEDKLWKRWQGFKPRHTKPITTASIFRRAQEQGWRPSTPTRPGRQMADPFEGQARLELATARQRVQGLFASTSPLWERQGVHLVGADTETGKTRTTLRALVQAFKDNSARRFILTFPTHKLCLENERKLMDIARELLTATEYNAFYSAVVYEAGRRREEGEHWCPNFDNGYTQREQIKPGEGARWCFGGCTLHAKHEEGAQLNECKWSRNVETPTRGTFIIIRTHQMHQSRVAAGRSIEPEVKRQVQWSSIVRTFGYDVDDEGRIIEPTVKPTFKPLTDTTQKGIITLSIHAHDKGQCPPCLDVEEHITAKKTPAGNYTLALTDQGKVQIARWLIRARVGSYGLSAVDDEYNNPLEVVPVDILDEQSPVAYALWRVFQDVDAGRVVIHDEDIIKTIMPTVAVSWDVWALLFGRGIIEHNGQALSLTSDVWAPIEQWRRSTTSTRYYTLDEAGLSWPDIEFNTEQEALYVGELLSDINQGAAPPRRADHEQREAIKQAINTQGVAVAIHPQHGVLIQTERTITAPGTVCTILLDATAHERALKHFYPNLHAHHIRALFHEQTRVIRADINQPRAGQLATATRDNISLKRFEALHHHHGIDGRVLHFGRKAYTPDEHVHCLDIENHAQNILFNCRAQGDAVLWHECTEARGSNEYETCEGVILDAWRVPGAIVTIRAQYYQHHADDQGADFQSIARWELEGAPVLQASQRVRARGNVRTVLYCAPEDIPGLESTSPPLTGPQLDLFMAINTGEFPACNGHQYNLIIREFLHGLLPQTGPLLFDREKGLFGDSLENIVSTSKIAVGKQIPPLTILDIYGNPPYSVAHRILPLMNHAQIWTKKRSGNDIAEVADLDVFRPSTNLGNAGPRWLCLPDQRPGRDEVVEVARDMGAQWVEVEGRQVHLVEVDAPDLSRVDVWSWQNVQDVLGVNSRRAARRELERFGLPSTLDELEKYAQDRARVDEQNAITTSKIDHAKHFSGSPYSDGKPGDGVDWSRADFTCWSWRSVSDVLGVDSRRLAKRRLEALGLPTELIPLRARVDPGFSCWVKGLLSDNGIKLHKLGECIFVTTTPRVYDHPLYGLFDDDLYHWKHVPLPEYMGGGMLFMVNEERELIQDHEAREEQQWQSVLDALCWSHDSPALMGELALCLDVDVDQARAWIEARGGLSQLRSELEDRAERKAIAELEEAEQANYERVLNDLEDLPRDLRGSDCFIFDAVRTCVEGVQSDGHAEQWLVDRGGPLRVRMELRQPSEDDRRHIINKDPTPHWDQGALERVWQGFTDTRDYSDAFPFTSGFEFWRRLVRSWGRPEDDFETLEAFQDALVVRCLAVGDGCDPEVLGEFINLPFDRELIGASEHETWTNHVNALWSLVRAHGVDVRVDGAGLAEWSVDLGHSFEHPFMQDPWLLYREINGHPVSLRAGRL